MKCCVVASIASRKSVAIAKSIKSLLHYSVVGVAHAKHPHLFSTVFEKKYLFEVPRDGEEWPTLVAWVANKEECEAVVPVDFADFAAFSKYAKLFNKLGVIVTAPSYEDIALASDRVRVVEVLKHIAEFPAQVFVKSLSDAKSIYSLSPPLVVKSLGDASNPSFHLDYESAINEASKRTPCIVQEYIEGIARGYYALSHNGVPIIEFTHQRVVEYLPIGGASLAAKGFIEDPELFALGRRVLKVLKWSGVIMVETRYSEELGKYYVLELNPKFWGSIDLAVALGYHFPALLVIAYTQGAEKAREAAKKLMVRKGEFIWILDGLRYVVKIPSVWLYLTRKAFLHPLYSDIHILNMAKNFMQFAKALTRAGRESRLWAAYLKASKGELKYWVKRFVKFLSNSKRVVIFDLDGTLIFLPVNWCYVRSELIELGFALRWESINRALMRQWHSDSESYYKMSSVLEGEELKALKKLNSSFLLAPREYIGNLAKYAQICIATKQSARVAEEALRKLGIRNYVSAIVGRDSGVGPVKIELYKKCLELVGGSEALILDDNMELVIEAYRKGFTSMLVANNVYKVAKSMRLGIPAGPLKELLKIVLQCLGSLQ
ncbi:MAG: hypothetical protein LM583_00325 [Desulfurococcaceae archaeon]|nr:hypothetical protein [Desulfurococcaceae archaeon]